MSHRLALGFWLIALGFASPQVFAAPAAPLSAEDLVTFRRISDPQPSPDGSHLVFTVRSTDLEANRGRFDLFRVATVGGEPQRLTTHAASDDQPRFAPDGQLFFVSTRSGSAQIWRFPQAGGEPEQVTDLPFDVSSLAVSPDGSYLAFALEVYADCPTLACSRDRLKAAGEAKGSGRVYEQLFVRHWDTWKDGRRSHLFVLKTSGGEPVDVSAGLAADVPSKPFGGAEEFAFTPDGKGIVFTARDRGREEPWSTDFNLFYAPLDGSARPRQLTSNPAWDTQPVFSPDGKTLAYRAMSRPGYEADRFRIVLRPWPEGPERVLTEAWDASPDSFLFAQDGKSLLATAEDQGEVPLFAIDIASGKVRKLVQGGHVRSPVIAGDRLVFGLDHHRSPVELYSTRLDGSDRRQLTALNREHLNRVLLGESEQFSFPGWNQEKVFGYVVKPVNFSPDRKYKVAFLIHGGPQGSFGNDFHYRWNPQIYAAAGYAAVMIDFHGSTGYGQAFTDSIRGDWGGKPLVDLQEGLAYVLKRYPWMDGDRVCALGASYGGFMINWIAGQWPDRFRCLVNHDGIFDQRSMYYTTEELWFTEWEFRGTPWEPGSVYEAHNPALFVDRWRTPMLVVQGALDFRVPESQGLATFTALQRRGIPSQFLHFPDENHWVLRPHNSIQWHQTVLAWLDRWLGKE